MLLQTLLQALADAVGHENNHKVLAEGMFQQEQINVIFGTKLPGLTKGSRSSWLGFTLFSTN